MYILEVILKMMLVLEHPRANVTLESLNITYTMNIHQVSFEVTFLFCYI